MGSSPEYRRYAELHYERKLPIVDASIEGSEGTIVFSENGTEIEVEGEDPEFLRTIQNLVPTVRDGVKQLIDVRDTPARNVGTYIRNWEFFLTNEQNPIQKAAVRINQGKTSVPSEFDAREAIKASIEGPTDNKNLQKIVENYSEVLAVKQSDANRMNQPFRKYKDNASYDQERFQEVFETAVEIFQEAFLKGPPLDCYEEWVETRETDLLNFSNKVLSLKKRKKVEWDSLKARKEGVADEDAYIQFWENKSENTEMGKIEGEIGIERILEQYSELFELAREPLRDLAATLDDAGSVNLSDTSDVLEFLDSNDRQSFTQNIKSQLRHGSSHASIETDDSSGILKIFNNRGQSREVVETVEYEEIPSAYYHLSDVVAGLLFAITRVNDRIMLRYMTSEAFRFRIAENIPPQGFLSEYTPD